MGGPEGLPPPLTDRELWTRFLELHKMGDPAYARVMAHNLMLVTLRNLGYTDSMEFYELMFGGGEE